MTTVLDDIMTLLEVDVADYDGLQSDAETYAKTLLLMINGGIAFLRTNATPLPSDPVTDETTPDEFDGLKPGDYEVMLEWLYLYCLQRFDASTMYNNRFTATGSTWIERRMTELLFSLKARYER